MKTKKNIFKAYICDNSGATAIEYGLIAALISIAFIAGANALGGSINGVFVDANSKLPK